MEDVPGKGPQDVPEFLGQALPSSCHLLQILVIVDSKFYKRYKFISQFETAMASRVPIDQSFTPASTPLIGEHEHVKTLDTTAY